jgi:hypothetical protein
MGTSRSRTLSVSIERDWQAVYAYASDPANLHHWAPGLGSGFVPDGDEWVLRDPGGNPVRMRFAAENPWGVLDHDVFTPGGVVHIAMRVMPNGDGAEFTFLLLQMPGMTDAEFERDAATVMADLVRLRGILEGDGQR